MPGHWKLNLNTKASRFIGATLPQGAGMQKLNFEKVMTNCDFYQSSCQAGKLLPLKDGLASSVISKTISWLSEEKLKIFPQNRRVSVLRQNVLENVKPGDAVATIEGI
ncbi:putative palmitoyltransferase AKR1 [Trichinella spiralis]|uniref:putative palmitoyltransferase AKR1 n=1 Tax=Trichinella spiralis TaxID=6334 RepID=UPI0001EFD120|nr:putative palmitoyltransferase AKR1 [Trichinella spiralis]